MKILNAYQEMVTTPPIQDYTYYVSPLFEIIQCQNRKQAQRMIKKCLQEILAILATPLGRRLESANMYFDILQKMINNEIDSHSLQKFSLTLEDIQHELYLLEEELISESLFPSHLVKVYPNINEVRSKKKTFCDISGETISVGTIYLCYRPLLHDISAQKAYILKRSMSVYPEHVSLLPTTIKDFELFNSQLKMCYEYQHEIPLFQDISANIGNSELTLQPLQRRNKRK